MIKKKVCLIVPGHWRHVMGGAQYQAKCIIDELAKLHKYDLYYVTRYVDSNYKPDRYSLIRMYDKPKIKRSIKRTWTDYKKLKTILKEIKPDIIYQRVGCDLTGLSAYLKNNNHAKMIWHIAHDAEVMPYKLKLSGELGYRYIDNKLLQYGIRNTDCIVSQTKDQAELLTKYFNREVCSVIGNFHPYPVEKSEKPNNCINIVWVANIKPWKQPEKYLELAKSLLDNKKLCFIMVGDIQGPETWKNYILQQISIVKNIEYLGAISQEEVNRVLSTSHIFVNTSTREGFANTFIQAWMRSLPVITLSVNPDSVLEKYKIGHKCNDLHTLKSTILDFVNNQDKLLQMGNAAREYAFEYHSPKNVSALVSIIDSLVE